jgi:Ca-activated chloride channel family protein
MFLAARARRDALRQLGAQHLLAGLTATASPVRRRLKQAMILIGATLLFVSLARPQLGYRWEEVHRRGVDLLFAVDTSKSMLTQDVKPDRLQRAKLAVHDLMERFPDDRVGLVAFAGGAFLQTPLTLDHSIFEESLDALDTSVIPLGGTDVASAIQTTSKAFSDDARDKVLVLLTDGEDLQGNALAAAEKAGKQGLVIDTVGVGTPRGELIPLPATAGPGSSPSVHGPTEFVRDPEGQLVTSRLDETLLRRIAQATGGTYQPLGDSGAGLESLYQESLSSLPKSDLAARSQRVPIERFQWPLGAALLLLGLEPLVGERRRKGAMANGTGMGRFPLRPLAGAAGVGLATLVIFFSGTASASPQSAERAYRKGHFDQAEADYAKAQKANPDDPRLGFDLGDAAYRKGDFDVAAKGFESSLHSDDLGLQTRAYYNLGNTRYRLGEKSLAAKDVDATMGSWKDAIAQYEGALRLDPKDKEAQDNLDLVKRRLADLQRQKDDQKQQPPKQDDGSSKDQKNAKDSKSEKGQGDSKEQKDAKSQGNSKGQRDAKSQGNSEGQGDAKGQGDSKGQAAPQNPNGQSAQAPKAGQTPTSAGATGANPADHGQPSTAGEVEGPSGPGELSKQEARALLDSLRGDLVVSTPPPIAPRAADAAPGKDW